MTNELTQRPGSSSGQLAPFTGGKPSALAAMAGRFSMDPQKLMETLKATVFKGASNEQLAALVVVANEHSLNPFTREIYAFPDKSGGIQAVIGVDGWIRIITQNPQFDGFEHEFHGEGRELACTVTLYRKDIGRPVKVTEYLSECQRNTDPWRSYPRRMLRHKALIQAGRIAFGLGSLKDEDDFPAVRDVSPVPATVPVIEPEPEPEPEPKKKRKAKAEKEKDGGDDFVLDATEPTPREILAARMNEAGVTWDKVAQVAEAGGLFVDSSMRMENQPEDVLSDILSVWGNLVEMLKGGSK